MIPGGIVTVQVVTREHEFGQYPEAGTSGTVTLKPVSVAIKHFSHLCSRKDPIRPESKSEFPEEFTQALT
jgi:hypothetical protein